MKPTPRIRSEKCKVQLCWNMTPYSRPFGLEHAFVLTFPNDLRGISVKKFVPEKRQPDCQTREKSERVEEVFYMASVLNDQ